MMKIKLNYLLGAIALQSPLLFSLVNLSQAQTATIQSQSNRSNFLPVFSPSNTNTIPVLPDERPYTLDTGDIIRVTVFGLPEQGGETRVFEDGTITFPLIGTVNIRGKTLAELNEELLTLYSRFLRRPSITATLTKPRPVNVAVVGEVNTPGNFTFTTSAQGVQQTAQNQQTTSTPSNQPPVEIPRITDLFTRAGGLTVSADVRQIQLRRQEEGIERIYNLDFWRLLQQGDLSQDVRLRDGDIVVVPKAENPDPREFRQLADATFGIKYTRAPNVTIVGQVNRPGSYTVPIDQGPPRLTTAIQQSGGIREMADIRNIVISRTTRDAQEQIINVDLWEMLKEGDINRDILLQDGDTIAIPMAEIIETDEAQALATANFAPPEISVDVVGSVMRPGRTVLRPNTSFNQAILAAGGFDLRRANQETVELIRVNPNGTVTKRNISVNLSAEVNEETNPLLKNNDVIVVNRSGLAAFGDQVESVIGPFGRSFSIFGTFYNIFRD